MPEYCTLDPISRKLTLTEPQRIAGVESDEYAKGLKFKFPKTVDNIDLTQMQLRINFMNSRQEKGQHIVTDMKPMEGEEGYITFTWPFSRLVTHYRGYTKFVVCAVKTDENGTITAEWNTALAQMRVLEGLEVDEPEISPEEKDVISQLISICQNSADEAAQSAQQAKEEANKIMNFGPVIGPNGNWYINGADTGKPSQGETPKIGENGNWFIGETDTGLPSRGITPNFKVGNTTTLPAGTEATANITGTPENPVLNFGIPQGSNGETPNIQIGTVETLPAGSEATANITGEPENPVLNLGIPQGESGGNTWRLIADVNVTEDVQIVDITKDTDNQVFRLSEVYVLAEAVATDVKENRAPNMNTLLNGIGEQLTNWIPIANNTTIPNLTGDTFFYYAYIKIIPNIAVLCWHQASSWSYNLKTSMEQMLAKTAVRPDVVTSIRIRNDTKDKVLFSSGTRIRIWGLDA